MANIDTPGYRAQWAWTSRQRCGRRSKAWNGGARPRQVRFRAVDGLIARPDGNNVSMDRESLNLAEAQLKFKTGVALIKQESRRVLDAIHADGK